MLMVAWRLMTSGESGFSFEGSIVARSCFARCELFEAGAAGSSEILAAAMAAVGGAVAAIALRSASAVSGQPCFTAGTTGPVIRISFAVVASVHVAPCDCRAAPVAF